MKTAEKSAILINFCCNSCAKTTSDKRNAVFTPFGCTLMVE